MSEALARQGGIRCISGQLGHGHGASQLALQADWRSAATGRPCLHLALPLAAEPPARESAAARGPTSHPPACPAAPFVPPKALCCNQIHLPSTPKSAKRFCAFSGSIHTLQGQLCERKGPEREVVASYRLVAWW